MLGTQKKSYIKSAGNILPKEMNFNMRVMTGWLDDDDGLVSKYNNINKYLRAKRGTGTRISLIVDKSCGFSAL